MALATTLLLAGCSIQLGVPGGSSVSGNARVTGFLFDGNGSPAIRTQVNLIPAGYNPRCDPVLPATQKTVTDSMGAYRFDLADSGEFNIQGIAADGKTVLVKGLQIAGTPVDIAADTVRDPGTIKIAIPDNIDPNSGYAYIPGTLISADARGAQGTFFILSGVPADSVQSVSIAATLTSMPYVFQKNLVVTPGDTTVIVNPGWRHQKRIFLNTTSNGAGVGGMVVDFPVFIRLGMSWGAFDFSEADGRGADIRFAKADGAPLSCEIEAWDSLNSYAELWVKVDTVFGNDSNHYFVMYWGNPGAASASNGVKVFDTANGFQGVWHMETAQPDTVHDATINHYNGVPYPTGANSGNPWNIGTGRYFDGTACIIIPQTESSKLSVVQNENYSIFAWVYVQKQDTAFRMIAGKGSKQYSLSMKSTASQPQWSMIVCVDSAAPAWKSAADNDPIRYNEWNLLVGVRRGSEIDLYVNGILVSSPGGSMQDFASIPNDAGENFTIGGFVPANLAGSHGGGYWKGVIDEVQFHNVARSPDWIRLYYQNQQIDDSLVVFAAQ
jgi:hypothetical protein